MLKTLKIDELRVNLLRTILKVDNCEKKEISKQKSNDSARDIIKKYSKEIRDLRHNEMACLYKYVVELERTHHHFNQK